MTDLRRLFKQKDTSSGGKRVFATVGTTKFDELVAALDTEEVQEALRDQGFSTLVVQKGKSSKTPCQRKNVQVEVYGYKVSLAEDVDAADLVISHAGAGSVMESLRNRKPLIVVANENLMDNHQVELATAMQERKHLYTATPSTLSRVIRDAELDFLTPLPNLDLARYKSEIQGMLYGTN